MGVPIETALRWEQKQKYDIPRHAFPPALRECVTWHFVKDRTKDWDARLKEYWDPNEDEILNNEKLHDYVQRSRTGHSSKDPEFYKDIEASLFQVSLPQGAEHQLRRTIDKCKQMRGEEFYGFTSLPSEIRDMIYGYALRKGRVIVPNNVRGTRGSRTPLEHYESSGGYCYRRYAGLMEDIYAMNDLRPAPAPLGLVQGVSRSVHNEATRVYFSKNQFIFPAGYFNRPQYCNVRHGIETMFNDLEITVEEAFFRDISTYRNNALLFRDVSYTFDMRDKPTDDYTNLYTSFHIKDDVDSRSATPLQALQWLHDQKKYQLEVDWAERIDSIKHMVLDRLVLDFQECYCAIGCCRKVQWVLDRFIHKGPPPGTADTEDNAYSSFNWLVRPPLVVEVMGLVNDEEEAMALKELGRLPGSKVCLNKTPEDALDGSEDMMDELFLDDIDDFDPGEDYLDDSLDGSLDD